MSHTIENAKCIHTKGLAILVEAPDFDEAKWIPISQIDEDSEVYKKGDKGDLIITDWIAEKKGLV